jgi:hypothetical protein
MESLGQAIHPLQFVKSNPDFPKGTRVTRKNEQVLETRIHFENLVGGLEEFG